MEDQVLDAESKAAPLQAPEAIIQTSDSVVVNNETPNKNIYGGSPVIGEKNYADSISTDITRSDYDMKSKVDKSMEPTVTTISTTKGNITDRTPWESYYEMEDQYAAEEGNDYSWNDIAKHRSQYVYEQQANQVLSDYAKSMSEIKEAGAQAMDQYFGAAYSANQTADKMGWQGGQVTSNDAKTAFLKASTAANLYNKFELQEYGVDSQLEVARMYAEANMEALALDIYQDELNKAVREAELVGYYISPEASEMMKQREVANKILDNPNSTLEQRQRANTVIGASNAYFDKYEFSKDENGNYIGIEVLANLEFKETKRANQEQERLQEDANQIADKAANAAVRSANTATNTYIYNVNQTEKMTADDAYTEAATQYGTAKVGTSNVGSFVMTRDKNGNYGYKGVTDVFTVDNKGYTSIYGKVNGTYYEMQIHKDPYIGKTYLQTTTGKPADNVVNEIKNPPKQVPTAPTLYGTKQSAYPEFEASIKKYK